MPILGGCPLCGRVGCRSKHAGEPGRGLSVRGASRRGLPLKVYETAAGETLRLNEIDARRLGLLAPVDTPDITEHEPDEDATNVPDGRVGEVLAWTGDDKARLTEALDIERAGRQRVSLVAELERRLAQ